MPTKIIVSTPLDDVTVQRLDVFCAKVKKTRAEVIRGSLHALLGEEKPAAFREWRKQVPPTRCVRKSPVRDKVLNALRQLNGRGMRARSLANLVGASQGSVHIILALLIRRGLVTVELGEPLVSGLRHKYYRLGTKTASAGTSSHL